MIRHESRHREIMDSQPLMASSCRNCANGGSAQRVAEEGRGTNRRETAAE